MPCQRFFSDRPCLYSLFKINVLYLKYNIIFVHKMAIFACLITDFSNSCDGLSSKENLADSTYCGVAKCITTHSCFG